MARSPRGSMQIADIGDATPGTRGHQAQSTCSSASAAMMRSPIASAPAGPPSGPAKRARSPKRAIATAALAAQPPEANMNADAWVFASGTGNCATRNTASKTAMPVQTTSGAERRGWAEPVGSLSAELNVVLHKGAQDVMGDGGGQRRAEAFGMSPLQHQRDLLAVEPACIVELGAIDDDLARERLCEAADHERHRERPRLRCEIGDRSADDAGLLARLAPDRLLDRLARLDKAGEARPHAGLEPVRAAQDATSAGDGEHDHDRIGARKMQAPAGWTVA